MVSAWKDNWKNWNGEGLIYDATWLHALNLKFLHMLTKLLQYYSIVSL